MTKLLATLGLAGALFLGATTDASAHGWRGPHHHGPVRVYRPARVVVLPAPVVVRPAPVYRPARVVVVAPPPVYRPVPAAPVVVRSAPVYRAPAHHGHW